MNRHYSRGGGGLPLVLVRKPRSNCGTHRDKIEARSPAHRRAVVGGGRRAGGGRSAPHALSPQVAVGPQPARSRNPRPMPAFIGAGPAPPVITVRGCGLLARCPVCLYAGSLVPRELLVHCPPGARIVDTAPMTLDEIEAEFAKAHDAALDMARLHSGDLSVYSALAEQLRRLERRAIPTLTPACRHLRPRRPALRARAYGSRNCPSVVLTRACPAAPRACRRAARLVRADARDARRLSRRPRPRRHCERAHAVRRGLSDRGGGAGQLARRTHLRRGARRRRDQGRRGPIGAPRSCSWAARSQPRVPPVRFMMPATAVSRRRVVSAAERRATDERHRVQTPRPRSRYRDLRSRPRFRVARPAPPGHRRPT